MTVILLLTCVTIWHFNIMRTCMNGIYVCTGANEYLVGASPEMFVRVEKTKKGMRVETCPISGTIERGTKAEPGLSVTIAALN